MKVSGHLHAPAALPPEKELRYPLDKRLGEEKISQPLPGIEPRSSVLK
jgi:hypothetical protein